MLCRCALASRVFRVQSLAYFVRGTAGVFAMLATTAVLRAQNASTGTIEGRVQHIDAGTYLNNARIRVIGTTRETFTNQAGEYRLADVPAGPVTLDVFYTGLPSQRTTVTVPSGGVVREDFNLTTQVLPAGEEKVVRLSPFVVAAQRETDAAAIAVNEQRFAANTKNVVSTDAFGAINQGNIGEFLKFIPGVSFEVKDGNSPSGIMIRGFNPNYTNVTMDGGQVASAIIANTQTSSRQFVLEQASINNISRIEVVKLPTPDMSANSLGGSVNLVSRSAFERPKQELSFAVFLSACSKDVSLSKETGPGAGNEYHTLPSFSLVYVNPISKNLGIAVSFDQNSQYYLQNKLVPGRRYSGSGATVTNPQTPSIAASYAPNRQDKTSASIAVDWKPWARNLLQFSAQATAMRQQQATRTITYNVGSGTPVSWSDTFTNGSTGSSGTGAVSLGNSFQNRNGLTRALTGRWTFTGDDWLIEAGGSYSNSNNRTRDIAKGFWNGMSVTMRDVKTVNLTGIDNSEGSFQSAAVLDASGNRLDPLGLANYNLGKVTSQPQTAQDTVKEVRLNITRSFSLFSSPMSVKFGGSANDLTRDIHYTLWETTYAGPDGVLNNGDETAAQFVDTNDAGRSPGFGVAGPQWMSPWLVYQAFLDHPSWFVRSASNEGDTVRNAVTRSPYLHERISAAYVMGDLKFFHNRLRLVGGVRYEDTADEGWGYLQDGNAVYQRDANGRLIIVNGRYVLRPDAGASGSGTYNALTYQYRKAYNKRNYHYFFRSGHATFNLTDNLLLRAAYAETFGRPRLSDVVPNFFIGDNVAYNPGDSTSVPGYIVTANTSLMPWTAKNYDYSLEYYLPKNGVLSVSWFKKDIYNFFSTIHTAADTALLDSLGLPHDYVGYDYQTRVNISNAMLKGWEVNAILPLDSLGVWGQHFQVTGNLTHVDLFGARTTPSDFQSFIPRGRNVGLRFIFPRVAGNLFLNWKGRMLRDTSSAFTNAREYIRARYQLDGDISYRFSPRFSVFFAARNLLNAPTQWEVSGPVAPAWAALTNYEDYGTQYSLGIRGTF